MFSILEIAAIATEAHKYQTRKSGGAYICHPIRVAREVEMCGGSEVAIKAALLHDVIEDTETSESWLRSIMIPKKVIDVVVELTDDKNLPKDQRKEQSIVKARKLSADACLVKVADLHDNCLEILSGAAPAGWGPDRINKYLAWALEVLDAMVASSVKKGDPFWIIEKRLRDLIT